MSEAARDNRFRFTTIAHRTQRFLGPLGEERAAWLLDEFERSGVARGGNAIDVGCGKAELALRATARFDLALTGIDPNRAFLDEAGVRAAELGVRGWLPVNAPFASASAHVSLPPGAFDLCLSVGASEALGGQRRALAALAHFARRDGLVLVADACWTSSPPEELLRAFGGKGGAGFLDPDALLDEAHEAGLAPLTSWMSSLDEWDAYEDRYEASMRAFLEAHPDDPEAVPFLERITMWSELRRNHMRTSIGFQWHLFRRGG